MIENKENMTLVDSLDTVFDGEIDYTKFTTGEIEDAKELYLIKIILIIVFLLGFTILGNIYLKKKKIKFLNESTFAIFVGFLTGMIINNYDDTKYLNSITSGYLKVFIIFLLPPIIFERYSFLKIFI